ncbi:prepilin peptidase [Lentilactobacillus parakefiri]|uniref:Peptidase n=1 Tax=Lentilactobacillus parakefiri TaxID=152332 RepID=A0A269XRQ4_9LACO|nr:A24 family peptidase [Lentilactobacillus parakefiri]KRL51019.1 peptidase A24A domain-containing protein [Lentilactobacillus parakefiri DSM 10551]PAK75945.1 peptidase [Lentilactobacillus parakefiri]PAL00605.1 peptidase [Lentilactobacillus parakefiri]TDG89568.1 hypothetical protein C5L28_001089 [Lentilactobacillus parakefiri]GAW71217.1 prepilin peptidase [Lentilactobacillus parakefiri]
MIIIQFLLGASLASFFNLVAIRTQRGESIVTPRSHCDSCGSQLSNFDLIPVFSYIILMGKCRYCKQKFSAACFTIELAAGSAAASLNLSVISGLYACTLIILTALSSFDSVNQQIPTNGIILLFAISGLSNSHPIQDILIAVVVYLLVQFLNHHFRWMGSGDIDIYLCLWLSSNIPNLLWQTFIACIAALLYLIVAPWPKESKIPFVPFITIGYFLTNQYQSFLLPLIS